jgi:hypothetical protein
VKAYAGFMSAELVREERGYVVRVTAGPGAAAQAIDEGVLAAELANYALGKTIERSRRPTGDVRRDPAPSGPSGEEGA